LIVVYLSGEADWSDEADAVFNIKFGKGRSTTSISTLAKVVARLAYQLWQSLKLCQSIVTQSVVTPNY